MALDGAAIEAVLREIKDEFGSAVYGVQTFADFMGRHGELKTPPAELERHRRAGAVELAKHIAALCRSRLDAWRA